MGPLTRVLRRLAQPLSAALLIAALGVGSALVVLAFRGQFAAVSGPVPLARVTPAPAATASPSAAPSTSASPGGAQDVSGTLTADVVIPLSSDTASSVTIGAGTHVQATVMQQNGVLGVLTLVAGQAPSSAKGKHKNRISGSTATATTITLTTPSGSVEVTIAQDSAVNGTVGDTFGLEFTAP